MVSRFDAQWDLIGGFLLIPTGRRGSPFSDALTMTEAIMYRYRTQVAWRDLPAAFGPWQTAWKWRRRTVGDGTCDCVHTVLMARAYAVGEIDGSVSMDPTIARAHQHATNFTRFTEGPHRTTTKL